MPRSMLAPWAQPRAGRNRASGDLVATMVRCTVVGSVLVVALAGGCKQRDAARKATADAARDTRAPKKVSPAAGQSSRLKLIDSHVHIAPLNATFRFALRLFDAVGVDKFAVKSAGTPGSARYEATLRFARHLGDRMAFFTNLDWSGIDRPDWSKREVERLEMAMRDGASGIKIFKALGLAVRLKDGQLLKVDDPRLDRIFSRAAELGAIVAWHVADPVAFFQPVTPQNERYAELSMAPDWSFFGGDYPTHEALLAARDRVVRKHPHTIFLGIHLANYPENLGYVDRLLDQCPNLYVDVAARLPEIGRHPADETRRFFIKHQDRILFGTDLIVSRQGLQLGSVSPNPPDFSDALEFYRRHRQFFETADRQFDHPTPIQGKWKIDGINLPPDVLRKVYRDNAQRLIFARRSAFVRSHEGKEKQSSAQ